MRQAQPDAKLIVCGDNSADWNLRLMAALGEKVEQIDLLSLHTYAHPPPADQDEPADTYTFLAKAAGVDAAVTRAIDAIDCHAAGGKKIDVIIDEWGSWHDEVTIRPGFPVGDVPNNMEPPGTMRDALYAARVLHVLMRHAGRVAMANLAQTVNTLHCLLKTQGFSLVRTPTYHVFDMLKHHAGAQVLAVEGDTGTFEFACNGNAGVLPKLDIAASMTPDGTRMSLSVVNPHLDREEILRLQSRGTSDDQPSRATAWVLGACEPLAANDFQTPLRITPRDAQVERQSNHWALTCAPFSLTTLEFLK